MGECSQKKRFDLVTRMGRDMIRYGGEIFRTKKAMEMAAKQMGLKQFTAYILTNGVFTSAVAEGEIYSTSIRQLPLEPVTLDRMEAVSALSRRVAQGRCGPEEMEAELNRIEAMQPEAGWRLCLAAGLGSGGFCYMFQGSWADTAWAFTAGVVLYSFILLFARRFLHARVMRTITCSMIAACYVCALRQLGAGDHLNRMMIGAVFPLVPGVALTNSFRNFLENDYLSGLIRLVDALLTAGCIALGAGMVMRFWMFFWGQVPV